MGVVEPALEKREGSVGYRRSISQYGRPRFPPCGTIRIFILRRTMESKRLRLTPGMARVEFLAVKDEVESLLARGYLLKPAYAQLTKKNGSA